MACACVFVLVFVCVFPINRVGEEMVGLAGWGLGQGAARRAPPPRPRDEGLLEARHPRRVPKRLSKQTIVTTK